FVYNPHTPHLTLHSFPTRRSSDLNTIATANKISASMTLANSLANTERKPSCCIKSSLLSNAYNHFIYFILISLSQYGLSLIAFRSEEHTSELQSRFDLVCRLLLEK